MKSVPKVTRLKLKTNHKVEFLLLGIVSAEPDYKLSLSINKKFRISLKNVSPVKIIDNAANELSYSRFSDINGAPDLVFSLYSNRCDNNYFLKKLKNVDFIFQVLDSENVYNIDNITSMLREIESVNAVFKIDINSFKDKNLQYLTH
jgi:hypothetical protein